MTLNEKLRGNSGTPKILLVEYDSGVKRIMRRVVAMVFPEAIIDQANSKEDAIRFIEGNHYTLIFNSVFDGSIENDELHKYFLQKYPSLEARTLYFGAYGEIPQGCHHVPKGLNYEEYIAKIKEILRK